MLWEIIGRLFGVYVIGKALCMAWSFLKSFVFPVVGWRLNLKSYGEWAGKLKFGRPRVISPLSDHHRFRVVQQP